MPAFDASALVPLFDVAHPNHARAKQRFNDAARVLLHPCILLEFTNILRRAAKDVGREGNREARAALAGLLAEPRCEVVAELDYAAVAARYGSNGRLSYADAVVVQMALEHDRRPPVSFDAGVLAAANNAA